MTYDSETCQKGQVAFRHDTNECINIQRLVVENVVLRVEQKHKLCDAL